MLIEHLIEFMIVVYYKNWLKRLKNQTNCITLIKNDLH